MNGGDAPVRGVVLCGGLSRRMGRDKGALEYHRGTSAIRHTVDLIGAVCEAAYLSVRPGQTLPVDVADVPRIADRYVGIGPIGAILTVLEHDPAAAWLVVACDMPLLDVGFLKTLVQRRDAKTLATCAATGPSVPEPLCAIWEPRSRSIVASAFRRGERSSRRVLMSSAIALVEPDGPYALFNANTPGEAAYVRDEVEIQREYAPVA